MTDLNKYFNSKSIIIVGPSATVKDDCKEIDVNSYDIVCRLNNHWRYRKGDHNYVGKRTDVIYHCLNSNQIDKKDLEFIKNNNITLVTRNEIEKTKDNKKIKNFLFLNEGINCPYESIPKDHFDSLKEEMKCNPSTGVLVISHILSFDIKSLTVVGFDFYRTLYMYKTDNAFLKKIQEGKISNHKPDIQLKYIKDIYKQDKRLIPIGKLKELLES